jgi:hypothetical protein
MVHSCAREEKMTEQNDLKVLFPKTEIKTDKGSFIMTPIPIEDLPDVLDSFVRILAIVSSKEDKLSIAVHASKDIMALLRKCVDRPLSEIPHTYLPDMISAFIDMNVPEELMGKWEALTEKVEKLGGKGQGIKGSASTER